MQKQKRKINVELRGKAAKFLVGAFLGLIVLVLAVPGAAAFSAAVSGGGTAHIFAAGITPQAGYGQLSNGSYVPLSLAVADTNLSDSSIISNTHTVYTGNTSNIQYVSPDVLFSNVSMSQLNAHGANKIVLEIQADSAATVILGFGQYQGTNFTFHPLENASLSAPAKKTVTNATTNSTTNLTVYSSVSFALSPALLLGNGTIGYEIQWTNATAVPSVTISGYAVGNTAPGPWYAIGMNAGYMAAFGALIVFGSLALPYHNVGVQKVVYIVRGSRKTEHRKTEKRRRK